MNESTLIDRYLEGTLSGKEHHSFLLRMASDRQFAQHVCSHGDTLKLVREYGRRQLLTEIKTIDGIMFTDIRYNGFRNRILNIFTQ